MNYAAEKFLEKLKAEDLHHREIREMDDGDVVIPMGFNLKNTHIDILVIFDEDCHTAAIRVFDFVNINESQFAKALLACNGINDKKRWVKFYIHDNKEVRIDADMMFNKDDVADNVLEVVIRLCSIADEAYPIIQKAIWS